MQPDASWLGGVSRILAWWGLEGEGSALRFLFFWMCSAVVAPCQVLSCELEQQKAEVLIFVCFSLALARLRWLTVLGKLSSSAAFFFFGSFCSGARAFGRSFPSG